MTYSVKEIFYTLQGEGAQVGRPAVFCRFTGCNLWTGREEDRPRAICRFCDTDFVGMDGPGGGQFQAARDLAQAVANTWPRDAARVAQRYVVCTGGEPLLQLDEGLVRAFHDEGFEVGIETNGTRLPPGGVDWTCVSPKNVDLVLSSGDELKLVFPQDGAEPDVFKNLKFKFFYLQPMDGLFRQRNTRLALRYCLEHPQWRLSVQMQKVVGIR